MKVILSEEPGLYVLGTVECETSFDPRSGKGQLIFSCTDADSYRYHVDQTVVVVSGGTTAILSNDFMPVVPVITTTAETAFQWRIDGDTFYKSVSAGTWEFPELELQYGSNSITISGSGTTTFTYREGRL